MLDRKLNTKGFPGYLIYTDDSFMCHTSGSEYLKSPNTLEYIIMWSTERYSYWYVSFFLIGVPIGA